VRFPVHLSPSPPRVFPCAVITEHPYRTRTPHPLTDQLRQQWLRIRAQNRHLKQLSHRPDPAHVEPSVPSTRNTHPQYTQFMSGFHSIGIIVSGVKRSPEEHISSLGKFSNHYVVCLIFFVCNPHSQAETTSARSVCQWLSPTVPPD
jgi:hypothetical protein